MRSNLQCLWGSCAFCVVPEGAQYDRIEASYKSTTNLLRASSILPPILFSLPADFCLADVRLENEEIGRKVLYRDVERDGAARAAARIAELI